MSQVQKTPSITIDDSQPDIDCSRIEVRRVAALWAEFICVKKTRLKNTVLCVFHLTGWENG